MTLAIGAVLAATWGTVSPVAGVAAADPAPKAGATIEGWVTRDGRPVAARVEVRRLFDLDDHLLGPSTLAILDRLVAGPDAWNPVGSASTDDAGHFEFHGLKPGVYDATAISADGASDWTGVTVPAVGARVEASLLVPSSTQTVRGLATYDDGSAFLGSIFWTPSWTRGEYDACAWRCRSATPTADGRFEASGVGRGDHDFLAVVPGLLRVRTPLSTPTSEDLRFVVDEGFKELRVRVVEEAGGRPVEGAALFAGGDRPSGGAALVRGTTGADGRCTLRAIAGSKAGVTALKAGYAETWLDPIGPGDEEIVIRVARSARVTGRLVRPKGGGPVEGVVVRASHADSREEWLAGRGVTDADGRYVIDDVQPGDVAIVAEGNGVASVEPAAGDAARVVTLEPGKAAVVDLEVSPVAARRGRVLDAEGRAVAGAVVRVLGHERSRGWKSFEEDSRVREVAVTAPDGTFALVRGGTLDVRVPGHARFLFDRWSDRVGSERLDVSLPPVRRVAIRVLDDATGKPMAGAAVEVRCWTRESSVTWLGVTDRDGRATSVPTIPGAFRVGAAARGYAASGVGSAVEAEVPDAVTIRLVRGVSLSGRVVLSDGTTPAVGAEVLCHFTLDGGYAASSEAVSGPDGSFRFDDLPPPPVEFLLQARVQGGSGWSEPGVKSVGGKTGVVVVVK